VLLSLPQEPQTACQRARDEEEEEDERRFSGSPPQCEFDELSWT